ncbi:hypothetical protein [Massilia endophytica]|uniref:hypothetical protein n=1 Tax=Massilia endophytica TaxID=2899220 RepID=UPI001E447B72|nr:hypothetical protein [Massilia endophytica]UGQ45083.1 hypothetical protein LSQ66_14915 [Massilia endophytica]
MSAHQQVLDKVVDVLKDANVASGKVFASRARALGREVGRAVVVRLERSASTLPEVLGARPTWHTLISVECYGRGTADEPNTAADAVLDQVFACLDANATLDGTVSALEPSEGETLTWDNDELDSSLACVTARFVITHQTQGRTLNP